MGGPFEEFPAVFFISDDIVEETGGEIRCRAHHTNRTTFAARVWVGHSWTQDAIDEVFEVNRIHGSFVDAGKSKFPTKDLLHLPFVGVDTSCPDLGSIWECHRQISLIETRIEIELVIYDVENVFPDDALRRQTRKTREKAVATWVVQCLVDEIDAGCIRLSGPPGAEQSFKFRRI